jgi:hypothetical protein
MRLTARRAFGVARVLLAGALVTALVGDFDYVLGFATFFSGNFFSYFTVQSAMAAVVLFLVAAFIAFRRPVDPSWLDLARVLVTSYMVVSGIVFLTIVIQSSSRDYTIDVPWSSQLLHFWMPLFALLDWMLDFGKARLSWRPLGWVLIYPVAWGVFTLVRGAVVGWYPYFFLDPAQVSGPAETAAYCAVAVALMVGIAAILTALTRIRWTPRLFEAASPPASPPRDRSSGR